MDDKTIPLSMAPVIEAKPRRSKSNVPPPGAPEEEIVAPKVKLPDDEIEKLITDNIKLAYWFANQWKNIPGVSSEDIESQAIHGLVKAANTYEPAKGNFSGYASQIIRNYLGHLHYHQTEKTTNEPASLDAPIGSGEEESGDSSMHDKFGDTKVKGADIDSNRSEAERIVADEIAQIPEPDRSMVLRWKNGDSYRDMQADFGLSFMQIRNRVTAAMSDVKARLAAKGILGIQDILPESVDDDSSGTMIFECLLAQVEIGLALKSMQDNSVKTRLEQI